MSLKLDPPMDFSPEAIKKAWEVIQKEVGGERGVIFYRLKLTISIYNAHAAILMMIDPGCPVYYVSLTPEFREYQFCLEDDLNGVCVAGGFYES